MKSISFLEGFLGSPLDWNEVIQSFQTPWNCKFSSEFSTDFVVGYSMGGRIALDQLAKGRVRPSALVLIAAHPGLITEEEKSARRTFENNWLSILDQESVDTFLKKWYAQPLFSKLQCIPPHRFTLTKEEIRHSFLKFSILKQHPLWDFLSNCSVPVLYIAGENDTKYRGIAEKLKHMNPHLQTAIVQGASHAVHLEKPLEVAHLLESFFCDYFE